MKRSLVLIAIMTTCCWANALPGKGRNPGAVAQVSAGELTVANASWWGFDSEDATAALQGAIDSKAKIVIVPYMGKPWTLRPHRDIPPRTRCALALRSNLELVFEPGVVVLAKKGEFTGRWDSLISVHDQSNITIRGYGAVFRMRKRDYPKTGEHRHALRLIGAKRILVEGLRMESSGGDGIYIDKGDRGDGCEDVVIRDCVSHDNQRQGISVCDATNMLVENCVFSGTEGYGPQAGIDFEPYLPEQKMINCVFRNCLFEDNVGHGMFVRPFDTITSKSEPISIRFENCIARMTKPGTGGDSGMCARVPGDQGPTGTIEFINCVSENFGQAGANVYGLSVGNLKIRFDNCNWINSGGTAVVLNMQHPSAKGTGGVEFVNCSVYEEKTGPAVQAISLKGDDYGDDIKGEIRVQNKHGARFASEPRGLKVNLLRVVDSTTGTVFANTGPAEVTGRIMPALDRRAGDIPGYDDEATFGELWATHDFIADLPKVWWFKLDFKDQGQKQDWGGVVFDKTMWQPIKIGEWWEPQGHQYDGIAWYRVDFDVPPAAQGHKLALSFGAVDDSAWVYLNGKQIGEHDIGSGGWDKRFEIALGDAVKIGETNVLAVRVRDRLNYGGIWKSVKLAGEKRTD